MAIRNSRTAPCCASCLVIRIYVVVIVESKSYITVKVIILWPMWLFNVFVVVVVAVIGTVVIGMCL